jgi:hypothetical protein
MNALDLFINIAVEPPALCYPALGERRMRGCPPTPRFRTIQVYPKSAARKHAQALALSKRFREVSKTGALEIPIALPLERMRGMDRMLRSADKPIPLRLARSPK